MECRVHFHILSSKLDYIPNLGQDMGSRQCVKHDESDWIGARFITKVQHMVAGRSQDTYMNT
jgi:hypothetical protein